MPQHTVQYILETIFWGALDVLSTAEIRPKLAFKDVPPMPEAVLREMYAVLAEEIRKMPRFENKLFPNG